MQPNLVDWLLLVVEVLTLGAAAFGIGLLAAMLLGFVATRIQESKRFFMIPPGPHQPKKKAS